jgi:hypothetical protein
VAGLVAGALLLIGGVVASLQFASDLAEATGARDYHTATAVITEAEVRDDKDRERPFSLRVAYEVNHAGRTYESQGVGLRPRRFASYFKASEALEAYPVGSRQRVYVDPDNAANTLLELPSLYAGYALALAVAVALAGGTLAAFRFRKLRRSAPGGGQATSGSAPKASAARRKRRLGLVAATGIGLLFTVIGGAFTAYLTLPLVQNYYAAQNFQPVTAEVIWSKVRVHDGSDDGTTYSIDVFYRYEVEGREHRSNSYRLMGGGTSGYGPKRDFVRNHPPGTKVEVHVNPEDPRQAFFDREFHPLMGLAFLPLLFVVVGLLTLSATGLQAAIGGGRAPGGVSRNARGGDDPDAWFLPEFETVSGPTVLEPKNSPLVTLVVLIGVAALWNVLTGALVWHVVGTWLSGSPDLGVSLMAVPFVLVGLGTIGGVVYAAMALQNPRPILTVSTPGPRLGETLDVGWDLPGRVGMIDKLTISLEASEEATYRCGTDTCIDRSVFYRRFVTQTDDPSEIRGGMTSLVIPADQMHSLALPNNRIVWELKVHGEIARWPDVRRTYTLVVQPREPAASTRVEGGFA